MLITYGTQTIHLLETNQISKKQELVDYQEGDEGSSLGNKGVDDAGGNGNPSMDADELGTPPPKDPSMVNGAVVGRVVDAAPPRLPERGGGGNPTARPRERVVAEPPPRPAVAAPPPPRPRVWLGAVATAPAEDISFHPTPARSATARSARQRGGET
jgi:hypothetical protein